MNRRNFIYLIVILGCMHIIHFISWNICFRERMLGEDEKYQKSLNRVIGNVCEVEISGDNNVYGTGFYVSEGIVLTCYHLFKEINIDDNEYSVKVRFYNTDVWRECEIFQYDKDNDIMAIELVDKSMMLENIRMLNPDDVTTGMSVFGVGNALGNGLRVCKGIVGIAYKKIIRDGYERGVVQTDIGIDNGDSGGPLFDDSGKLVGIISFRLVDSYGNATYANSYAISIKEITEFMKELKLE